jgi:two-component system response regulator DesR
MMSAETEKIRVVFADDQRMVLDALTTLLESEGDITVLAQAEDGHAALAAVLEYEPDIFVTDIEMPQMTGLEVAGKIKGRSKARTVIVTTFARAGYLRKALEVGASGYVLKTRSARELAETIRRVHSGVRVIDPELAAEALGQPDPLTDRERQVLQLTSDGLSTKGIAAELGLSPGTVRNYLSESIDKLDAANRFDAARIALENGWL